MQPDFYDAPIPVPPDGEVFIVYTQHPERSEVSRIRDPSQLGVTTRKPI